MQKLEFNMRQSKWHLASFLLDNNSKTAEYFLIIIFLYAHTTLDWFKKQEVLGLSDSIPLNMTKKNQTKRKFLVIYYGNTKNYLKKNQKQNQT